MKKILKPLIIIACIVLVLLVAGYLVISALLTSQKMTNIAEKVVSEAVQQPVEIGKVSLQVGFKIGIKIEDISMKNAPGFSAIPMIQIDKTSLNLKLLPLLRRQIVINDISLSGIKLSLERNTQGQLNVAAMLPKEAKGTGWALSLSSIDIHNSNVKFTDAVSKMEIQVNDLNQNIRFMGDKILISGAQEINIAKSQTLPEMKIEINNKIEYDTVKKNLNIKTFNVALKGMSRGIENIQGSLSFDQNAVKNIAIQGELGKTKFSINGSVNNLAKPSLDLTTKIEGDLQDFEALTNDMKDIKMAGPLNINVTIKGSTSNPAYFGNFSIMNAQIDGIGIGKPMSNFRIKGNIQNDVAKIDECSGIIGRSDFSLNANISNLKDPIIQIYNKSNRIDLDELFPKPEKGKKEQAKPLPVTLQGNVKINTLTGMDMEFKNINTNFNYKNGIIDLKNCAAEIFDGKVNFDFYYNTNSPEPYKITTRMTSISSRKILKRFLKFEAVDAKLTGVSSFQGDGFTQKEVISNLTASGNLNLTNGAFKNFKFLTDLLAWLGMANYNEVKFNDLTCNFNIEHSKAQINDWTLSSSIGNFLIGGTIGLTGDLQLNITTTLSKQQSDIVKHSHGDWLLYFDKDGRAVIDLVATGKLISPKFSLDTNKIKKRFEGKMKDEFDKKKKDAENKLKDLFKWK